MKIHAASIASAARRIGLVLLSSLVLNLVVPLPLARAQLFPGDIIIGANIGASTTSVDWGLLTIDPATGNRTIIADNTHGTGPALNAPTAVTLAADGSLLVTWDNPASGGPGLLYRIDPATGDRTIISSAATDAGPTSTYTTARQFGGGILMSGGPIVSVDTTTGDRTLVSGTGLGTGLGTGPAMTSLGFVISATNLFVANSQAADLLQVDTLTGNRTVLSSASVGAGPSLTAPEDIEFDHAGHLLVVNWLPGSNILSVDPLSGNRTLVTGSGLGIGPSLGSFPGQLGVAADGTMFISQQNLGLAQYPILSIDPLTGNRTIVSDATHGTGPLFDPSFALLVVPTPEPSTILVAALGGLALLAYRGRQTT